MLYFLLNTIWNYFTYLNSQSSRISVHNPNAHLFAIPQKVGKGWCEKCYFCLVFKNPNHELRNHSSSNYSHDVHSFTCFWRKIKNIKPQTNQCPQNPILLFVPYEILNSGRFISLDTLFWTHVKNALFNSSPHAFLSCISNKSSCWVWHAQ